MQRSVQKNEQTSCRYGECENGMGTQQKYLLMKPERPSAAT